MNKLKKKVLLIISIFLLFTISASNGIINIEERNKSMFETLTRIKQEEYHKEIIEKIEFEAEVKIPDHVDIEYIVYMYETAIEFNLPIRTIFRLINQESQFIVDIVSIKGAYGFMQLMPATYVYYSKILNFGFIEDHNPYKNIYIGMYILSDLYEYFSEYNKNEEYVWVLTLSSYNAGMGRVRKYNGMPPFKETRNYIAYILREHSQPILYAELSPKN